jgi:hypothetical protein
MDYTEVPFMIDKKTNLSALILGALLLVFLAGCPLEAGDPGSGGESGPPPLGGTTDPTTTSYVTTPVVFVDGAAGGSLQLADYIRDYGDTNVTVTEGNLGANISEALGTVTIAAVTYNEIETFTVEVDLDNNPGAEITEYLIIAVPGDPNDPSFTWDDDGTGRRTLKTYSGSGALVVPFVDDNGDPFEVVGIADVASSSFAVNTSITALYIPDTVVIHPYAFYGNTALTMIYAPGATSVGDHAFEGATGLTELSLPRAESIGIYAFNGAVALKELSIPRAVSVGNYAFENAVLLEEVSLPAARSIGNYAFHATNSLREVFIPVATVIGTKAFYSDYNALETVTIGAGAGTSSETGNTRWESFVSRYNGIKKRAGTYVYRNNDFRFSYDD